MPSTNRSKTSKPSPSSKRRSTRKKSSAKHRRSSSTRTSTGSQAACLTGTFQGDIHASGDLKIASGAKCNANLKANCVEVEGDVSGKVIASQKMKLGSKSRIRGEIVADKLVASDGAAFVGTVRLGRMNAA